MKNAPASFPMAGCIAVIAVVTLSLATHQVVATKPRLDDGGLRERCDSRRREILSLASNQQAFDGGGGWMTLTYLASPTMFSAPAGGDAVSMSLTKAASASPVVLSPTTCCSCDKLHNGLQDPALTSVTECSETAFFEHVGGTSRHFEVIDHGNEGTGHPRVASSHIQVDFIWNNGRQAGGAEDLGLPPSFAGTVSPGDQILLEIPSTDISSGATTGPEGIRVKTSLNDGGWQSFILAFDEAPWYQAMREGDRLGVYLVVRSTQRQLSMLMLNGTNISSCQLNDSLTFLYAKVGGVYSRQHN